MKENISKYRSDVIEKFINIETFIDSIISMHYLKKVSENFLYELLYDANCSFALKRNVLQKIAPGFKETEDLNRLNTIRNYFAHCGREMFDIEASSELGVRGKIIDPKDIKKELNFEELYNEFINKEGGVLLSLLEQYTNLGGVLYPSGSK